MAGQFIVVQNQSVQLFEILQEMEIPGCLLRLNITKIDKVFTQSELLLQ